MAPTNGSGEYTLPTSYFVENGDTIQPVQHNPPFEDVAQGLTDRVMRNGSASMTGNLNMDTNKIVGLAEGVNPLDAVNMSQLASFAKVDVANTWTAAQTFDGIGQSIIVKSANSNTGQAFIRFQDADGDNIGYVGMGSAGSDSLHLTRNVAGEIAINATSTGTIAFTGIATFNHAVRVADGTVSAPSIAPAGDTNTGFYSVGADNLGITCGGGHIGHWNTTGWTIATTSGATTFGSVNAVKNLISGGGQVDITNTTGGSCQRLSRAAGSDGIVQQFHRNATLVGNVSVTGSATAYNTSSDERLKPESTRVSLEQDIDLDAVWAAIEPLAYNMVDHWSMLEVEGRYHGMLAQQLHKVYPQAVTVGEGKPGDEEFIPWSIDYSKLVPLMIARQKQFERRTNERFAALGL